MTLKNIIEKQRAFFLSNKTKDLAFRKEALKKLKNIIKENEDNILVALEGDLGKSAFEGFVTEIAIVYEEINLFIKNLDKWAKRKRRWTPLVHFPASSYEYYEPLGVSLIISPWNYPFQLAINPLVASIGAGNTTIIKASNKAKATSKLLKNLINNNFPQEYIYVVDPETTSNQDLLEGAYDHIFFTGSTKVGKEIMKAGSQNLAKITLELGGKSPAIIDSNSDLDLAAKRIVWGKLINAGQTCVAPDYVLVEKTQGQDLKEKMKGYIEAFYGPSILDNLDYPKIINEEKLQRLIKLLENQKIYCGGDYSLENRRLQPTIVEDVNWDNKLMEEEIFGPIFPIIEYENLEEEIEKIKRRPKPLALYYFTKDKEKEEKIIKDLSFGGGTINDTIVHLANPHLEFGGVGQSGTGGYHGKYGFINFSNRKSIMKKSNFLDLDLKYPPFKNKIKLVKKIMK